jgi:hypothetical protein
MALGWQSLAESLHTDGQLNPVRIVVQVSQLGLDYMNRYRRCDCMYCMCTLNAFEIPISINLSQATNC